MTNKEKSELQKEIVNSINENDSGRLILAPRIGKTKLVIDLIKRDKPKSILWVTPTTKLAEEDIPEEFVKWKAKRFLKKLTTVTWKSLDKMQGHYDLIVLDEEQFITERNAENLLNGKLKGRIISMTGTESKHKDKKDIYKLLNLDILYSININEAVDIGLLSNYEIKVIYVPLDSKKNVHVKTDKWDFMTSELKSYERLNRITEANKNKRNVLARMNFIKNSQSKIGAAKYIINSLKGKKLIFAANIKQAEQLSDFVYHSKTDSTDLQKFISGDIDKIAMINKGGTGYTYTQIDHLILTQVDSDNNGLTSQKIARSLLKQKDYEATIWIIVLKDTQDTLWLKSTLKNFSVDRIEYINFESLII